MPAQGRKRTANNYDSDDGFVAGSDEDDSAPKTKKAKTAKADTTSKGSKKGNSEETIVGGGTKGVDGEEYWEVSSQPTRNTIRYLYDTCTWSPSRKELGEWEGP